MKQNNKVSKLRLDLISKEKRLLKNLDEESTQLEHQLQKGLKTVAIIGTALLIGTAIFKMFENDEEETEEIETKKAEQKTPVKAHFNSPIANGITSTMIGVALKKLIPLAIDKLKKAKSK